MATRRVTHQEDSPVSPKRGRPAVSPEAREQQMIALAYDVVETRMRKGTATSQETTHFLKLGSTRNALEQERIEGEILLNKAKIENMAQQEKIESLMTDALAYMRTYKGEAPIPNRDYDED